MIQRNTPKDSRKYEQAAGWHQKRFRNSRNYEYPEIDTASAKISILEKNGCSPVAYFVLPEHCWLDNYYRPMQNSFAQFLQRNGNSERAQAIVAAEENEIALYEKNTANYSYGVYIARRSEG